MIELVLNKGATRGHPQHGNNFTFSDLASGAAAASFPGFSYFMNFSNMKIVLDAINRVTDVDVLSTPSLTVMENKKAVLQVGDEVPITTGTAVSTGAPNAPIVNSVSFRSTGVILGITPRVSDDGRVVLDIEQEVSSVVPTKSSNIDSPTIQQRRVKTTVTVNDGESILLAGLVHTSRTRECCRFRGSLVALDAETGKTLWRSYTIPQPPVPVRRNALDVQLWGPSGALSGHRPRSISIATWSTSPLATAIPTRPRIHRMGF